MAYTFTNKSPGNGTNFQSLIVSLASAFGVSSPTTPEQAKIYNGLNTFASSYSAGDRPNDNEAAPKAFVTILFFDRDYNFIDAAWDQITTTGEQVEALCLNQSRLLN